MTDGGYLYHQKYNWGMSSSVIVKALDYRIIVSEF